MIGDAIRILVVDDHNVVRAGIKALLAATPDIRVVGEASNGREAVELVTQLKPDIVLMDLSMPDGDGIAATKQIVVSDVGSRVLILTMHADEDYLVPAMEAGASGYLLKSNADRELVNAIRSVAHGDVHVQSAAARNQARKLAATGPGASERQLFAKLTDREREVLRGVAMGFSAPEIGEQLQISPKTVDTYRQRIQEKANLSHRSEYVQFALKLGLLSNK